MGVIEILAVIGVIGYIIFRQVRGEPLRGRRTVLLPVVLTVVGFADLRTAGPHMRTIDIACITAGCVGSALIGFGFGVRTRLEPRDGCLWARLPTRGLWLWAALIVWRGLDAAVATGLHAHVAASTATMLFSLGVNRLGQAAVVVPRALATGVPFAPEAGRAGLLGGRFAGGMPRGRRRRSAVGAVSWPRADDRSAPGVRDL